MTELESHWAAVVPRLAEKLYLPEVSAKLASQNICECSGEEVSKVVPGSKFFIDIHIK